MKRTGLIGAALIAGCAVAAAPTPARVAMATPRSQAVGPGVELFFKGELPFARRGCPGTRCEEWPLGDVTRAEMVFSPDKRRFAYLKQKGEAVRVLIRNLAGDPVNEFAIYRSVTVAVSPGKPDELAWIDNRRLSYVTVDQAKLMFVVHDAETGEVLAARSGGAAVWGPQRRHLAFVAGATDKQALVVDGRNMWPRRGTTRIHGQPVWSPDGHGLAFVEDGNLGPRLVVLVEYDDASGDLTWPVPRDALAEGLRVFWAGDNKVVIGESTLRPRFAADWERLR